jgi:hypothetical protein
MKKIQKKKRGQPGLKLAAVYGLAPQALGFCGPQERASRRTLTDYLENKASAVKIRKILEKFEAAFAYLELIARKNKIKDPFNMKVVEAFWVGNELLDKVNGADLQRMVLKKFIAPGLLSKNEAQKRIKKIYAKSKPHHSFHVYIFGTITGRISLTEARLKDVCRIGWGKVQGIKKAKIVVEYRPIIKKKEFIFGKKKQKEISWNKKIIPNIKIGDQVSFHWETLCQKLSASQVRNLRKYTQKTLDLLK